MCRCSSDLPKLHLTSRLTYLIISPRALQTVAVLHPCLQVIEWQHVGPKGAEQSALVKEGVVAVMLNHPNIVRTFDFGIRKRRQPNAGRVCTLSLIRHSCQCSWL